MFLNFKRFKKNSGALITTLERNHKNTKTTFIEEHHSPRKVVHTEKKVQD